MLDEYSAPKVVIVMPCYNEEPDILMRTIDSLADCEYPPSCLHIFLSFDGDQENELYLNSIEKLGVPLNKESYPKSIDVAYRSTRITVSRFPHGGKRSCQKRTFRLIDKVYAEYLKRNDNLFILFIDSDCILDRVCIQNFMYEMELKPGSKRNMLAMTGVITSTTEKNSLITILQDMEYVHGQLFERTVESGCGAVTCLPGALTILRFSAFRKMAKYYFSDKAEQCDDLFDYGKCHLGEDRWLTHLFMIGAKGRYQIQMNTGAFCKTEAVQNFRSLLKQRRRWFLGFITNEVCMLTDIRLWRRYTILCIVRFMQNTIRTTALLFFIMVLSMITTSQAIKNLPVGFIGVSLGLNWLLMLYFGLQLGRYKIMMYPIMFVVNPFFNWMYMVYGIFTAGQRTWGGPRADAATATAEITPADAIAKAEATGDDLNVVPETFKPAIETHIDRELPSTHLMPSVKLEGRFAAADELPGGWYKQNNYSGVTLPDFFARDPNTPRVALHPRSSFDSLRSVTSAGNNSVYFPRRVESFVDVDDAKLYHMRQAEQAPAGGAFYESPRDRTAAWLGSRNAGSEKPNGTGRDGDGKTVMHRRHSSGSLDLPNFNINPPTPPPGPSFGNYPPSSYRSARSSRDSSPGGRSTRSDRSSLEFAYYSPSALPFAEPSSSTPRGRPDRLSAGGDIGPRHRGRSPGRSPLGRQSFSRVASPDDEPLALDPSDDEGIEMAIRRSRLPYSQDGTSEAESSAIASRDSAKQDRRASGRFRSTLSPVPVGESDSDTQSKRKEPVSMSSGPWQPSQLEDVQSERSSAQIGPPSLPPPPSELDLQAVRDAQMEERERMEARSRNEGRVEQTSSPMADADADSAGDGRSSGKRKKLVKKKFWKK